MKAEEQKSEQLRTVVMRKSAALWSLILLFFYYEIDRWTPLERWNGEYHWPVQNDQASLDVVVGVILLLSILSFWRKFRLGMIAGTALLGLWVFFHLQSWWIPYFEGVHSARAIAFHSQFLDHTQVLPTFGHHFAPDAEHTFIDLFVFPAFVLCLLATIRSFISKRVNATA